MSVVDWEYIGNCDVDAGLIHIGDPCYLSPYDDDEPRGPYTDWGQFCDLIGDEDHISLNHELGHPGLGVVVRPGYGDGSYPVYITRNDDGAIAEVRIVFIGDDDEEEEEE